MRRYLLMARGSLSELDTQVVIAYRLGYANDVAKIRGTCQELFAMLNGLIKVQ